MKKIEEKMEQYISGKSRRSYEFLGAQVDEEGVCFRVWAPNAKEVSLVGDFNLWDFQKTKMKNIGYGIWETYVEGMKEGEFYKFCILGPDENRVFKADPYAFFSEKRPKSASVVYDYKKIPKRKKKLENGDESYRKPVNIYEVHLGSWKKFEGEFVSYREIAKDLVAYLKENSYNYLEIMPIMEHPLDESWGYQITGFFSVTSRYGTPEDFKYLIDECHRNGIRVILDWSPGHFCKDEHGLYNFDGTRLYGDYEHPDWGTLNFDFKKGEVCSFLLSNAFFWFDVFQVDGLRVDAVSSMIFLDYGINEGEWKPNIYGGNENLEAIDFLKNLNREIFGEYPKALMIAEESTAWPLVTYPIQDGGLGFNYKWNMGWMNDILRYMEMDSFGRSYNHNLVTFSMLYAFSENFILPLSHDEVVHGKKSLLDKMPGNYDEKFANLRILFLYMITHPGKKVLFMGGEFGQFIEWNPKRELDWFLLDYPMHGKLMAFSKALNKVYKREKALWEIDDSWDGFRWIDSDNYSQNVVSFCRYSKDEYLVVIINFSGIDFKEFKLGVPENAEYREVINSDLLSYGGGKKANTAKHRSKKYSWQNMKYSITLKLAPYSGVILKKINKRNDKK